MYNIDSVVLIGAGRVATHLGLRLAEQGVRIAAVWSRTESSARRLGEILGCPFTTDLNNIPSTADVYLLSVVDDSLRTIAQQVACIAADKLLIHTAGSRSIDDIRGLTAASAVLYPMQTFSLERPIDWRRVPIFIEASDARALAQVRWLAEKLTMGGVYELSSVARRQLHVAAVFACNFANHCYAVAEVLLSERGLPFSVMQGLVEETALKTRQLSPRKAQTGPASRGDQKTMAEQMELLSKHPAWREIYRLMSQDIQTI